MRNAGCEGEAARTVQPISKAPMARPKLGPNLE